MNTKKRIKSVKIFGCKKKIGSGTTWKDLENSFRSESCVVLIRNTSFKKASQLGGETSHWQTVSRFFYQENLSNTHRYHLQDVPRGCKAPLDY